MSNLTIEQLSEGLDFDTLFDEIVASNNLELAQDNQFDIPEYLFLGGLKPNQTTKDTVAHESQAQATSNLQSIPTAEVSKKKTRSVIERIVRLERVALKFILAGGSFLAGTGIAQPINEMVHDYSPPAEAFDASADLVVSFSAPTETILSIPASSTIPETTTTSIVEPATTVKPAETVPVTTTTVPVEVTTPVVTEAPTTTTVVAEATVAESTVPVTEAPAPMSLTEQFEAGRSLDTMLGAKIGELILTQLCEKTDIYVENVVDTSNPLNWPRLTADAQAKLAMLNDPNVQLTDDERLMLEDDIQQSGIANGPEDTIGIGSPMYALLPQSPEADPELADCVPTIQSTRGEQAAYGSTQAVMNGGMADQYIPIADVLPEFAALPGGGKVTYIQGHRSSQSAAFKDIHKLVNGNTAIYVGDDGEAIDYVVIGKERIDDDVNLYDLAARLNAQAAGQDWLVLQVCIDGQPNNRALVILQRV